MERKHDRRRGLAVAALVAAGFFWGTTVPLSKVALHWLPPAWLTFVRFGVAALLLLPACRSGIRAAICPGVLACGAIGYGGSVLLQNAGIARTSVSHAALLVGAVPVLVAIFAALWHRAVARPLAWAGFAVSLAGVGVVTSSGAGSRGTSAAGDGLVLLSVLLSAALMVAQVRLLRGRDPVAVTAVEFAGAAIGVLPVACCTAGMPAAPSGRGIVLATAVLVVGGTLAPFTLFAYGQRRVPPEVAGAFVNIEPVVGAVAGVVMFGDPATFAQVAGGVAILAGIAMSSLPALRPRRYRPPSLKLYGPGTSPGSEPTGDAGTTTIRSEPMNKAALSSDRAARERRSAAVHVAAGTNASGGALGAGRAC